VKYFISVLVVVFCGLAYLRTEQPQMWNDGLNSLKVRDGTPPIVSATAPAPSQISPPVAAPVATPATTLPIVSEVISPDSKAYINPDHVRQVEQPGENPASSGTSNTSAVAFVPPDPLPAQPNWTWTVLGKDYHNVVVTRVEADQVHIMYDGGIGAVNTSDLPPDMQKMFNYDPATASKVAKEKEAERAKIDAEQAPLIAAELQKQKDQAAADATARLQNIQNQNASANASVSRDQIQAIQQDMQSMVTAHEVTINTNPQTGAVTYGGNSYWLNKYYADQAAIAQWSHH